MRAYAEISGWAATPEQDEATLLSAISHSKNQRKDIPVPASEQNHP